MLFSILSLTALCVLQRASSHALPSHGHHSATKTEPVIAAYYAWHDSHTFGLSNISWHKYNTLIYSFAKTTSSVQSISLEGSNPSFLPKFIEEAHKHNITTQIALGGRDGSKWYSTNVASKENRSAFVKIITDFAEKYKLDGIDFHWEFPNNKGTGCNNFDRNDTENFLIFLKELRAHPVGRKLTLSAAAPITPWNDASGKPSKDVSGFAKVLDYISIMNYDVWDGRTTSVGPNSPLNDTCASPENQQGSAVSAIKAWTDAGIPAHQLVLTVPTYGHSYSVPLSDALAKGSKHELSAYPRIDVSRNPPSDEWAGDHVGDSCGDNKPRDGRLEFWALVENGFLNKKGLHKHGIYRRYDHCSHTPFVYNETSQIMVSYENARSFAAKGQFIREAGLRGFALLEAGGDYRNILLDSIKHATGYKHSK